MTPSRDQSSSLPAAVDRNGSSRDRLLTADELAERWQISSAQVYRLARERVIPSVPLGRYVRFRIEAIEAWEIAQEARADG